MLQPTADKHAGPTFSLDHYYPYSIASRQLPKGFDCRNLATGAFPVRHIGTCVSQFNHHPFILLPTDLDSTIYPNILIDSRRWLHISQPAGQISSQALSLFSGYRFLHAGRVTEVRRGPRPCGLAWDPRTPPLKMREVIR